MSKIYLRSDSSYYWWTAYYKGRRLRQSTKFSNKTLAQRVRLKWDMCLLEGDISFYESRDKNVNGLDNYLREYLIFLERRKSSQTLAIAKGVLNKFYSFITDLGLIELKEIDTSVLNRYIDFLDCAPKTKKNHIGVLSLMFKQAQINRLLKNNTTDHVT